MKCRRIYLFLLIPLLMVFFANIAKAKAMHTGFSTEEMSEEDKAAFLKSVTITRLRTPPQKKGILQFDVNEQGMIAVCQGSHDEICVYSALGEFLYGYSIKTTGAIYVEWDHENLNIFFIRGETVVSLDPDGNIIDIKDVPSTVDNSIYLNALESTHRTIGDTKYRIRNDQGFILNVLTFSFSQIVVTDPDGTERIIYDINTEQIIKKIVFLPLISIAVAIVIVGIVRECKKATA
ncbi:MAG: hypothetical protein IJS80_02750 [Lachnospiraceae bacterium]|nr:hypothetical protein [Lachnospiraceae bacterium]